MSTKITIKFGMTYNLGDYSNVRPEITLEADSDDPADTTASLHARAVQYVHDAIDAELEALGKPPRFYDGPRYGLAKFVDEKLVAILPQEFIDERESLPGAWGNGFGMRFIWTEHRLDTVSIEAVKLSQRYGFTIIDCSDGDVSHLPDIRNWLVIDSTEKLPDGQRYLVILPDGQDELPGLWSSWQTNRQRWSASVAGVLERAQALAADKRVLLDLRDGDVSRLPQWESKPDESVLDEDTEGYDDDEDDQ